MAMVDAFQIAVGSLAVVSRAELHIALDTSHLALELPFLEVTFPYSPCSYLAATSGLASSLVHLPALWVHLPSVVRDKNSLRATGLGKVAVASRHYLACHLDHHTFSIEL